MNKNIVFLSHSSKDKKLLVPFREALVEKTNGTIEFFLSSDGQSIPLGHNWVASLEHSLEEAKLAFCFLSANSIVSTWVAFEAGYMHSKKIRVIPVTLPGVDFGQVAPPISLLQGFNMHSFEAMNNIFEILNKEFDHHHKPSFTQEEFNKFFGRDSDLSHGFFGEYSQLVSTITFTGELANPSLFSVLESELSKQKIVLKQTAIDAACPGLTCMIPSPKYFNLVLHSELSQILLPTVCSVVNQTASKPFNASVDFVDGVQSCGQEQRVSARAYGTEFVVQANGRLCFRSIQLENMHFKPLYLKSESAIQPHDLRDLIISLFESQMIELRPEQSTTELTQVLKILGRRRR